MTTRRLFVLVAGITFAGCHAANPCANPGARPGPGSTPGPADLGFAVDEAGPDLPDAARPDGDLGEPVDDLARPVADGSVDGFCAGDRTVHSRAELESLGNCREIYGQLTIQAAPDITDLSPLAKLQKIDGGLWIDNNGALTSLHGLEALTNVYTSVFVLRNAKLTQIDALAQLESVGGTFEINGNAVTQWNGPSRLTHVQALRILHEPAITHVGGFTALATIDDNLYVYDDPLLTTFDDLPALAVLGGEVRFTNNDALTALSGFAGVQRLGTLLVGGAALQRFDAFANVKAIDGNVSFADAPELAALPLPALQSISGTLTLSNLAALADVHGFDTLSAIGRDLVLGGALGFADLRGLGRLTSLHQLTVGPSSGLRTLDGLDGLQSLGYLVVRDNADLKSLSGIGTVKSMATGRTIDIEGNASLEELGTLNQLMYGGEIEIAHNPRLERLAGLRGLTNAAQIRIIDNPKLTRIDGLDLLSNVWEDVVLSGDALVNLDELRALTSIKGSLSLDEARLVSVSGLGSLTSIGDSLSITFCSALGNLAGLEALRTIGGNLIIEDDAALTRVDALTRLTSVGPSLTISDNASLPSCQADGVAVALQALGYHGIIDVSNDGGSGSCN